MNAELWDERLFWAALLIVSNGFTYWTLRKQDGTRAVERSIVRILRHDGAVIKHLTDFLKQAKRERQGVMNTVTHMADVALRNSAGGNGSGGPLPPFDRGIPPSTPLGEEASEPEEDAEVQNEPFIGSDKV
jgi:hypothetical protein